MAEQAGHDADQRRRPGETSALASVIRTIDAR
jgi:hypothetical protein